VASRERVNQTIRPYRRVESGEGPEIASARPLSAHGTDDGQSKANFLMALTKLNYALE
jgi:hypothetical protein